MSAPQRIILNGRDGGSGRTGEAAKAEATTATDLMNRLNRIMTSLKADHIQASNLTILEGGEFV